MDQPTTSLARRIGCALACAALASQLGSAQISAAEALRLGKDLTPTGAERAANADGSIPAWTGAVTPTATLLAERPLFTITRANVDEYRDKLPAGAVALLGRYESFALPVYATRRTLVLPSAVTETVREQATKVSIEGYALANRGGTTTPFPIPANGVQVLWNHQLRYLGGGIDRTFASYHVHANGTVSETKTRERRIFPPNLDASVEGMLMYCRSDVLSGPAAGRATLLHDRFDLAGGPQAWAYDPRTRRVKRTGDLVYDGILDARGMCYADQFDACHGPFDRFEYTLVGKVERYVPYNAVALLDPATKHADVTAVNTPNPAWMRYELHRVWVVEARLVEGQRHPIAKRTLYVDEDSWSVLWEDAWDGHDQLWRIGVHPVVQFTDANLMFYAANIWHDLSSGDCFVSSLASADSSWQFDVKGEVAEFEPSALGR